MIIDNLFDIPKLGFGLMRLPKNPDGSNDIETSARMVDLCLENGFYYFDTAYTYDGGGSERAVKEILVDRHDRESFLLATKLPGMKLTSLESKDEILKEQLDRTGAGYFDFYLLHAINDQSAAVFEKYDCFNWMLKKKEEGTLRHIGFSYHGTPDFLDGLLDRHPEVEFVQLQINYADWERDNVQSRGVYEVARKHNIPITVMEPVKGGSLAILREDVGRPLKEADPEASYASWALRFVASKDGLLTVLSGMSNMEQMEDNLKTMKNFKKLTAEEEAMLFKVNAHMDETPTVPCTGCRYCVEGCPAKIAIPNMIKFLNTCKVYGYTPSVGRLFGMTLDGGSGLPSACVSCGQCEGVCPQRLPIVEIMKEIKETVEDRRRLDGK